ncbi:hypothetical protein DV20_35230 [Amycolatopsis rifamycinica]|uniref:Uncharacterized protein n=1 Tax=Amycolatopsis rifamycinica TaxID=287986 RepID=A0A066U018_9PSEU|nr:hypothetical protein DV20_35230 [Amycolatopsis rifamycinica]
MQAAVWLGRNGVRVGIPTRLLATRLGVRNTARPWPVLVLQVVIALVAIGGAVAYQCLQYLPGVRGVEMTESKLLYFLTAGMQLAHWCPVWRRDRRAVDLLGDRRLNRPRPSWRATLDGWYLASAAVTFAGGAALGITMFAATPYRTYAWSWLGLLVLGAVVSAVIVTGVVRRPVIAEDEPSAAVDAMLRRYDLAYGLPSLYALPVLTDLITTHRQPPGFAPWLIGYAVLVLALQIAGAFAARRRPHPPLPDGDYGVPLPAQAVPGWSPEGAR